jgi:hypothetical protein
MLFMVEDAGGGALRSALFTTVDSEVVNDQRLGALAVGVANDPTTPVTYNVEIVAADTEYSQLLPSGCRSVAFRCREHQGIRFAWETGKVATPTAPYQTLKAGAEYWKDNIQASVTLYVAAGADGVTVEIEAWS